MALQICPGHFPETPAAVETGDFSVNPLPAADGAVNPIKLAPGEKVPNPSSFTTNSITSGVHDDPELVAADKAKSEAEPTFGISPLPAFAGCSQPYKGCAWREASRIKRLDHQHHPFSCPYDKESYENSGALGHAPVLPPVVTPQAERDLTGAGVLDLPPITKNLIPESSLPLGDGGAGTFDANSTIQSTGPQSTTTLLAAKVPLESTKVPEVVKESQKEAGSAPEASAIPSEVSEKSAVEKELKREVSVASTTSEGVAGQGTTKTEKGVTAGEAAAAAVGAAAIAVGGAAYAAAATIPSKLPESVTSIPSNLPESLTSKLPESVQQSINSTNATGTEPVDQTTAEDTPEIVKESIVESGQSSEAAASETAVLDKKAVEKELLSRVQPEISTAKDTPEIVKESIVESGQSPEAAANEEAVLDKKAFEKELLSEIKPETSTGEPAPKIASAEVVEPSESATPAAPVVTSGVASAEVPTTSAAVAPTATSGVESTNVPKISEPAPTEAKPINSRDVSPHTTLATDNQITDNQTAPVVTSGLGSTTTPEQSNASPATPTKDSAAVSPAKSSAESAAPSSSQAADSAAADKKKKRTSFFGKLKAKFHKD
ncbi:hypothetical protein DID88_006886 [Monilinia fructigena]|uniref:Uncharacterized protein n=1 Tax=Monilinia fructigena TaxID=38457 RepID=A0A395IGA4_9HELO|nr:hypothetical protein DID88_006886 [Monilinia fructigena]